MATLNVILKNTKGQPICNAANIFMVGVTSAGTNEVATSVKELENGKYSVSFTPVALVQHVVSVQINGMHITNNPTKIKSKKHTEILVADKILNPFHDADAQWSRQWQPMFQDHTLQFGTATQPLIQAINYHGCLAAPTPVTIATTSNSNDIIIPYHEPYVNVTSQPAQPLFLPTRTHPHHGRKNIRKVPSKPQLKDT